MSKLTKSYSMGIETSLKHILREYAEALLYALILALFFRTFIISAYRIPSFVMAPTLIPGDFIFAYKLPFGVSVPFIGEGKSWGGRSPHRGELVIFECPHSLDTSCMRRVIGQPGDRVEIRGKRLILNGKKAQYRAVERSPLLETLDKPSVFVEESIGGKKYQILIGLNSETENFGPMVVPPGHLLVLSDNRDQGEDSRFWGPIPVKSLEATAGFIWLSLGWEKGKSDWLPEIRWTRVFKTVD
ncbi:MAG: signal peptidase I [Bdellovibrionales bacterium]|nr:signal peptidase I [Bdellovibrionales bacterium]